MIRGERDLLYRKLTYQYRQLMDIPVSEYFTDPQLDNISQALWILENQDNINDYAQGTAFMLEGVGLVTCAHTIRSDTEAFQFTNPSKRYPITEIARNDDLDIAVISISPTPLHTLPMGSADQTKLKDRIILAGFPSYAPGYKSPQIVDGRIASFRTITTLRWVILDIPILKGNSGGPVLNSKNEVIGIAAKGSESLTKSKDTDIQGAIPINALQFLKLNELSNSS